MDITHKWFFKNKNKKKFWLDVNPSFGFYLPSCPNFYPALIFSQTWIHCTLKVINKNVEKWDQKSWTFILFSISHINILHNKKITKNWHRKWNRRSYRPSDLLHKLNYHSLIEKFNFCLNWQVGFVKAVKGWWNIVKTVILVFRVS